MVTADDAINFMVNEAGWSEADARAVVEQLLSSGKWNAEAIILGFRADFRCEYCDRDLMTDADTYKMWEHDHLIPRNRDGPDDLYNLVLVCSVCNVKYKSRWDPRTGATAYDRDSLLSAARRYVSERRAEMEVELTRLRKLLRLGRD